MIRGRFTRSAKWRAAARLHHGWESDYMNPLLFVCTGNYYRSRFAEVLFNHLALRDGLRWRADSRALRLSPGNVGPISVHALDGLRRLGIQHDADCRFPILMTEDDLRAADLIVALKQTEHRPMFDRLFPAWAERVEYWSIDDIDCRDPALALVELERAVNELAGRLRQSAPLAVTPPERQV
jgi:protein-tyrosine phosphatase